MQVSCLDLQWIKSKKNMYKYFFSKNITTSYQHSLKTQLQILYIQNKNCHYNPVRFWQKMSLPWQTVVVHFLNCHQIMALMYLGGEKF